MHDFSAAPWTHDAPLTAVLASTFRGKLCANLLRSRAAKRYERDEAIYEIGDRERTLFFLKSGFAKIGTITEDGREIIYDVRKAGDVLGELCAGNVPRQDRAVALEPCEIVAVAFDEVLATVQQDRALLDQLLQALCASLSDAYDQLNSVAFGGTVDRVVKLLRKLGSDLGRRSGDRVEIPTYLTQEEIAQMIAVRRERVSLAMNVLRDKGLVQYSRRGTLVLDPDALDGFDALAPVPNAVPSPV
ncbi:MAG TPA: Crp/Fnr family transcriptional regulator [Alphaproteobacteria bacterium]|nr:Crp/Fnr family transcriptional regulator [Alphaproteobacteria bacterium]